MKLYPRDAHFFFGLMGGSNSHILLRKAANEKNESKVRFVQ